MTVSGVDVVTTPTGVRIAVDDLGQGPPVVLTHGWVVGGEMWEYVALRLADSGLRAVSVTRRGCGRSGRPGSGYDLDTLADDLTGVLESLDLREVTLVAHSAGGAEAVRMLARSGADRVARLVLVASTTPGPLADDHGSLDALLTAMRTDRPGYVRAGVPAFFGESIPQDLADWGVALTLRASLPASLGVLTAGLGTDTAADLAACPVPALVIHGDQDASAPLDLCGRPTAAALRDSRLQVYAGAAHGLPLTHPEQLATDIRAFATQGAGR
jgi:pimeloyl-ACP methyl ester carboxylesterase